MTALSWIWLLLLAAAPPVGPEQRAINRVIASLNNPQQRARVFASDADSAVELARLEGIHGSRFPGMLGVDETWTELSTPRIVAGRIRLLSAERAVVEGESRVEGAVTVQRSVSLRFVLRKEEEQWRIVSIRVVAE